MLSDIKHRIFPRPFERLAISGKNLIGVEIGVYKAEHAVSLLTHLDIKHLYLVDPYELYDEYEEGQAHYGVDQDPLHIAQEEASKRLSQYIGKVSWIFKKSLDALIVLDINKSNDKRSKQSKQRRTKCCPHTS